MSMIEGDTPATRRYPDPFEAMTAAIAPPLPAAAGADDEPCPQITKAMSESGAGAPSPLRPARARANDARYGGGQSYKGGVITPPIG